MRHPWAGNALWPSRKHPRELSRSRLASGPRAALLWLGKETNALLGKKYTLQHAQLREVNQAISLPPRFHPPQNALLQPCRLTETESCCKIAQHHRGSEKQVTSSVEAHKDMQEQRQRARERETGLVGTTGLWRAPPRAPATLGSS